MSEFDAEAELARVERLLERSKIMATSSASVIPLLSVVVACHGDAAELSSLLSSLDNQKRYVTGKHSVTGVPVPWAKCEPWGFAYPYVEVILSFDGEKPDVSQWLGKYYNLHALSNEKLGGVGHHTRGPGIAAAEGAYIHLSNQDNQYMLGWLDQLNVHLGRKVAGMIYTNCVNNLWGWKPFDVEPKRGRIDLACAVVRADIAKEIGFPYADYEADGMWIEDCIKLCKTRKLPVVQIDRQLVVHN